MWKRIKKLTAIILAATLLFEYSGVAQAADFIDISAHVADVRSTVLEGRFRPLHLRFLSCDTTTNTLQLFLDKGNNIVINKAGIEDETRTLLKYFLTGVSLPNDKFWVNLNPNSPDRILDDTLASTDVGKIILEADLQLKKDTAKYTSPVTSEGRRYWEKMYEKARELFGTSDIEIPTLTRTWIVPGEIIIRQTPLSAYVCKATLKVLLEEDYMNHVAQQIFEDDRMRQLNEYSAQVLKELIIPQLTREVNTAKTYAALRQVYYSLILAQWFKQRFAGAHVLNAGLIDSFSLEGLTSVTPWLRETYYKEYLRSLKQGEYDVTIPGTALDTSFARRYTSGGIMFDNLIPLASSPAGRLPGNEEVIHLTGGGEVRLLEGGREDSQVIRASSPIVATVAGNEVIINKTSVGRDVVVPEVPEAEMADTVSSGVTKQGWGGAFFKWAVVFPTFLGLYLLCPLTAYAHQFAG